MTTGRVEQARELMLRAAEEAQSTGKRAVWFKFESRSVAFSTRQCCYAAQRVFIKEIERAANAEGKDPRMWVREQLLDGVKGEFTHVPPATWPSASILYKRVNDNHYLVVEFRRIATDPLWSDMLTENMSTEAPKEETLRTDEIVEGFK